MSRQKGGGSVGQSLRYVDPNAPEQTAGAGSNLLVQNGLIVRPAIGGACGTRRKRKGGFYPSIMGGVVNAGMLSAPLAAFTARKLFSKSRHGGTRKGDKWKAQREEAKAELQAYGKPTAVNIQKYAVAKRRGSEVAEVYLQQYRKRKQENAEAKEAKKEAKRLERQAKKASRNATKKTKVPKAKKEKTKKNKPKGKHVFFNNEGREINRSATTAVREAVLNSLAGKVNSPKTRKSPGEKSKKYFEELRKAREYLSTVGAPTGPNMSKYASMKIKGTNTTAWLENFKTRRPLGMATKKTKKVVKPKTPEEARRSPRTPTVNRPRTPEEEKPKSPPKVAAVKTRKSPSNKSKKYFDELKKAREYLSTVGAPTGPNMSKYASMKMKGENTSAWLENFKTRRPLSMASTKKARKPKTKAVPKPLTAVKEENENEMQGYSENFESEN
jgi:hypothetical protein